jgi:hypothetical protein
MANVTYLLGAGASYGAVAVNRNISKRLDLYIQNGPLENYNQNRLNADLVINQNIDKLITAREHVSEDYSEFLIPFFEDLKWLYNKTKHRKSVDEFAKVLYHNEQTRDLKKFKYLLSAFITMEQIINPPDNRYSSFLSKVKSEPHYNNISVLTWNYDFQFELANREFSGEDNLYYSSRDLGLVSKNIVKNYSKGFSLVKLNGTAGLNARGYRNGYITDEVSDKSIYTLFDDILKGYYDALKDDKCKLEPTLSFAWEEDSNEPNSLVEFARKKLESSDHIVVIGYSFPEFNAKIDQRLFGGIDYTRKNLIVQDPSANLVIDRLGEITTYRSNLKAKEKDPRGDFYIPREIII